MNASKRVETSAEPTDGDYCLGADGIARPPLGVAHREEEYDSECFQLLLDMQRRHFWYRGRHRFLLHAMEGQQHRLPSKALEAIDLGGGCGGWVRFVQDHSRISFRELALGDSSETALSLGRQVVIPSTPRYQVDLLDLRWRHRWDMVFLLDVLEHIPDHVRALRQVYTALRPGGLVILTTPALQRFWTYNDELAHHVRRYSAADHVNIAKQVGFDPVLVRYFMFFLSPLLLLSRLKRPHLAGMTRSELRELERRTQGVPPAVLNEAFYWIFALETPLGLRVPFPWGTSVLAILRKPR